ncbi:type III-B CRISPR-associated protein Cas10/Cmr2 [Candidatus Halobeggiatoa sp. HSG11]|nr:type III-B CRISPR-associated protein Cas10/Cmr2 [Candidatus Halobeggiatoa sp. HSG11]
MEKQYFHFTIGPVQSFVAQARRTRDFWAGSFLLSWLSGVAMVSVEKQNGKIEFPTVNKDYLTWIKEGYLNGKQGPQQGGIPNRFKAEVNDKFAPQLVIDNVNKAWCELAKKVWDNDLANSNQKTKDIWDRQIESFWEISWVLTEDDEASDLLDRRKNWRNHFTTEEPGIKCMMMVGWQELSGELKPTSDGLENFWQKVRKKTGLDLRENEHLCAIAFVKRRFVHHFQELKVKNLEGQEIKDWKLGNIIFSHKKDNNKPTVKTKFEINGWELKSGIPSVSYMAAVHWLEDVIKNEEKSKLKEFFNTTKEAKIDYSEWHTDISCLKKICDERESNKELIALDGRIFFISELENKNLYDENDSKPVITALKQFETIPSPFYAILMMDGDSLGSKIGKEGKAISEALKNFTESVPDVVYEHSGFLIYAGGDDVLAVLPVEGVFKCAINIRKHYQKCFKNTGNSEIENSTISAAVEFAHMKTPLTKMLRDAHRLLDNVAKDGCGRDSVAVRVWKPGGTAVQWAMPWECALNGDELILEEIADKFRDYDEKESGFTNNFFYKIRERFEFLNPLKDENQILNESQQLALLATDYVNAGNNKELNLENAEKEIKPLLNQCRRYKRDVDESDIKKWKDTSGRIDVDGALLIRFLVNKGVEKNG